MKPFFKLLIAFLCSMCLFSTSGIAQDINGKNVKTVVTNSNTTYTSVGFGYWAQLDAEGKATFYLKETSRDEWSVYLLEKESENKTVLDLFQKKVKQNGNPTDDIKSSSLEIEQAKGQNVHEVTTNVGVQFLSDGKGNWVETNSSGKFTFRFTETKRDEWSVYLQAVDSKTKKLALDLYQKKVKVNGSAVYSITNSRMISAKSDGTRTQQTGGMSDLFGWSIDDVITEPYVSKPSERPHNYEIWVDHCHDDLNNEETNDYIYVKAYIAEDVIIKQETDMSFGRSCRDYLGIEWQADPVFKFQLDYKLDYFVIGTVGRDALFIDEIRVTYNGNLINHHGRENGGGWCLSHDPNDIEGWEGKVAGNRCKATHRFEIH